MSAPKHETSLKLARKLLNKSGLVIVLLDKEWAEFAAMPYKDRELTPQNVRGIIKRTLRVKGYTATILESQFCWQPNNLMDPHNLRNTDLGRCSVTGGATFQFYRTPASKLPAQTQDRTGPARPPAQTEATRQIALPL